MLFKHRSILPLFCVAMVVLNALPIMSVYSEGNESCTLMVRGYNLLEFGSWGAIPVFAVVLILGILFSSQKKSAKNAELLLLLCTSIVCYVESFGLAKTWLDSVSNSPVNCHFGMIAFPLGIVTIIFWSMFFVNDFKRLRNIGGVLDRL